MSEKEPLSIERRAALKDQINLAQKNAIGPAEADVVEYVNAEKMHKALASGILDVEEFNSEYRASFKNPRNVICSNAEELAWVLREIDVDVRWAEHERAHWETALSHGFEKPVVGVYFVSRRRSSYLEPVFFTLPGCIPEGMSGEAAVTALRVIIGAPTNLSSSDKQMLGQ